LLLPLSEDGVAIEYVLGAGNYRPLRDDEADPFPDALDLTAGCCWSSMKGVMERC
jgi:hypothetical protein